MTTIQGYATIIVHFVTRYESSIGVPMTKDQNGILVSTLSHTSRRLLKEFSLRYGVVCCCHGY